MNVYREYLGAIAASQLVNPQPASYTTLRRVWKRCFPFVKTPRNKRFSKCKQCMQWKVQIHDPYISDTAKARLRTARQAHWDRVTRERRFLGDALMRSAMDPDALMVIEIDGMDSAKTILPHLAEQDKGIDKHFLIQYHLVCVKHNGTRPDEVYYYTNELPHDSANTCTIVWLTLMKVRIYACHSSP